jgi:hypothetical protein
MERSLFLFLVPGRLLWKNDWSQHWKSIEECCSYFSLLCFVLALVSGRSKVIALRRSYCDDCSLSCFYYCSYHKNIVLIFYFPLSFLLFWEGHK